MEQIYEISRYYPIQISDPDLKKYINHHLKHLQRCSENELFSSAFVHLHILYMIFVYFQLLRIAQENEKEFKLCWIGFPSQEKEFLEKPEHPFSFCRVNEKTVFRFFRLVEFNDSLIGEISAPVKKRNDSLHASGTIYCELQKNFEELIEEYVKLMDKIVAGQSAFINKIYSIVLEQFDKDYLITDDDIKLSFGNFSELELILLATNRGDTVSKYIQENY